MFHVKHSRVFSLCNQKGGVGKTTSAINISTGLSINGYSTLLIDLDPQANSTSGVGEDKDGTSPTTYQIIVDGIPAEQAIKQTKIEHLSLLPSNPALGAAEVELIPLLAREFKLKKAIDELREKYDYILIDCPPSLGLLTVNALTASDHLMIPLQCEYYALEGLSQLIQTYSLIKKNLNHELEIGCIILTMADFRTNLTEQVIQEVRMHFKDKVLETVIPRSVGLSEAPSFGQPGILYQPSSKGAKSYWKVIDEFLKKFPRLEVAPRVEDEIKSTDLKEEIRG